MDLCRADYLNSVAPHEGVAALLDEMKSSHRSWHSIIRDERYASMGLKHAWFTNVQKGTFYRLISPPERTAFLDVGAGSGIVSACLSPDYERGYALDFQPIFADFMNQRFAQDAVHNVEVVHGNALEVPLQESAVDLAAVNGVLQWIPHSDPASDPRQVQLRLLREVRRCLKPGGKVVLAVENGWHHKRLKGHAVDVAARVSGSVRNRLTNNFNRHAPGQTCRKYLHSYFGYRKLLHEVGFKQVRFYVLMPGCELPIDIYSFDRKALHELFSKYHAQMPGKRALKAFSDALRVPYLWAYFEAAFYVEATR